MGKTTMISAVPSLANPGYVASLLAKLRETLPSRPGVTEIVLFGLDKVKGGYKSVVTGTQDTLKRLWARVPDTGLLARTDYKPDTRQTSQARTGEGSPGNTPRNRVLDDRKLEPSGSGVRHPGSPFERRTQSPKDTEESSRRDTNPTTRTDGSVEPFPVLDESDPNGTRDTEEETEDTAPADLAGRSTFFTKKNMAKTALVLGAAAGLGYAYYNGNLDGAISTTGSALNVAKDFATDYGGAAFSRTKDFAGTARDYATDYGGTAFGRVKDLTGTGIDYATDLAGTAKTFATDYGGTAFGKATELAGTAKGYATDFGGTAKDYATTYGGAAWDKFPAGEAVASRLGDWKDMGLGVANSAWDTGTGYAGTAWNEGTELASNVLGKGAGYAETAWNEGPELASNLLGKGTGYAGTAWNVSTDLASNVLGKGAGLTSTVFEKGSGLASTAATGAREWYQAGGLGNCQDAVTSNIPSFVTDGAANVKDGAGVFYDLGASGLSGVGHWYAGGGVGSTLDTVRDLSVNGLNGGMSLVGSVAKSASDLWNGG